MWRLSSIKTHKKQENKCIGICLPLAKLPFKNMKKNPWKKMFNKTIDVAKR